MVVLRVAHDRDFDVIAKSIGSLTSLTRAVTSASCPSGHCSRVLNFSDFVACTGILTMLSAEEIDEYKIDGQISITCEFCNTEEWFDSDEIDAARAT